MTYQDRKELIRWMRNAGWISTPQQASEVHTNPELFEPEYLAMRKEQVEAIPVPTPGEDVLSA